MLLLFHCPVVPGSLAAHPPGREVESGPEELGDIVALMGIEQLPNDGDVGVAILQLQPHWPEPQPRRIIVCIEAVQVAVLRGILEKE